MSGSGNPHAERRAFRDRRVQLAFLTSAGSKALGLLVQFLAVPLAVRSLGPERFGIYTMLVSALVWIDLGRLGIGPGLTRELAIAWSRGERDRERTLFSNAIFFLIGMAAAITAILTLAYFLGREHIDHLFGPSAFQYRDEIIGGSIAVGVFLVAQIIFSAGEAARSAYQDDFITNLMNSLANLVSLILILGVALFKPSVPAFAIAVFGAIALGKGVNLALLLTRRRSYLFPRWRFTKLAELRPLLAASLAFWIVQIATLLMHNLSLVQLGQIVGPDNLTPYAVVFRLLQLLSTAVLMISMPLWPALTDAAVRGDSEWIARAYRRLLLLAMGFSILAALGIGTLGGWFISLWAGPSVRPSTALTVSLGVYFVIWMWNHCHTVFLFGLGGLRVVAGTTLAEGTIVLALAAVLVPIQGSLGTALALCIAGLITSGWILPIIVRRRLVADRLAVGHSAFADNGAT